MAYPWKGEKKEKGGKEVSRSALPRMLKKRGGKKEVLLYTIDIVEMKGSQLEKKE